MISILEKSKFINVIVSVVLKKDQKYLLVKESEKEIKGLWNFPAGKVEFGESLFEAAKREAKEETGYVCEIIGLIGINFFYWDDMPGLSIRFNFLGEISSDSRSALADDISETAWFGINEIETMDKNNQLRGKTATHLYKELKKAKIYPKFIVSEI